MMICLMPALFDLAGVSSSGRLRLRTPLGISCIEIASRMGFGRAHNVFLDRFVSEGRWRSFAICFHHGTRLTVHADVRGQRMTWKPSF
jgi:hypothetical protein